MSTAETPTWLEVYAWRNADPLTHAASLVPESRDPFAKPQIVEVAQEPVPTTETDMLKKK